MTYNEFLRRVQEQASLESADQAGRAVTATFETLRGCLANGPNEAPQEILQQIPRELTQGFNGQPLQTSRGQTDNPQLAGQQRRQSGGESTAESGQ
jgi:uncharacterized protein (DUF2267 family)